ncbi:hypothetical protein B5807_04581 [Epicoccum nigrum]|uniref:Putative gamma-glutamylcyclotransferase n=1 Tax=Epicoccum nigrum TaxID=105696 RepID=A0A1Y2M4Q0_EPING|nr:hypothetical protein B5807_04581 [Epicoccum nigrum]
MDYFDELDDSAIEAFADLGLATEYYVGSHVGKLSDAAIQALADVRLAGEESSSHPGVNTSTANRSRRRRVQTNYLLRLDHPFTTPRDVAHQLGLSRVPEIEVGEGEDGSTCFCHLDQSVIDAFDACSARTAKDHPGKKWTKVILNIAHKDTALPHLGRDETLPQHRLCTSIPRKAEYPVDYFFYGTLAAPDRLARLFGVEINEVTELRPAICLDDRIRIWAKKYRALVGCPGGEVQGHVFRIKSVEEEKALRAYDGDSDEVVDARVVIDGKVKGFRTFRYAGYEDELEN